MMPSRLPEILLIPVYGLKCLIVKRKNIMENWNLIDKHAEELAQLEFRYENQWLLLGQPMFHCLQIFSDKAGWATKIEGNTIILMLVYS